MVDHFKCKSTDFMTRKKKHFDEREIFSQFFSSGEKFSFTAIYAEVCNSLNMNRFFIKFFEVFFFQIWLAINILSQKEWDAVGKIDENNLKLFSKKFGSLGFLAFGLNFHPKTHRSRFTFEPITVNPIITEKFENEND